MVDAREVTGGRARLVGLVVAVDGNGIEQVLSLLRAEHDADVAAAPVVDLRDAFAAAFPEIAAQVAP